RRCADFMLHPTGQTPHADRAAVLKNDGRDDATGLHRETGATLDGPEIGGDGAFPSAVADGGLGGPHPFGVAAVVVVRPWDAELEDRVPIGIVQGIGRTGPDRADGPVGTAPLIRPAFPALGALEIG